MGSLRKYTVAVLVVCGVLAMNFSSVFAAEKPNILVVWGDDIGQSNISHYTHGMMGYKTPNIDRIAEEEPENEDYPKSPDFLKKFGPRGVIHSTAGGTIEDTGPLTKKRMETIDDETSDAAIDFIEKQHKAGKPWFFMSDSS